MTNYASDNITLITVRVVGLSRDNRIAPLRLLNFARNDLIQIYIINYIYPIFTVINRHVPSTASPFCLAFFWSIETGPQEKS